MGSIRTTMWDVIYFVIKPSLIGIVGDPNYRLFFIPGMAMVSIIDFMGMLIFFITRQKKERKTHTD